MISPEILKKIQEIKIRTRRVMDGTLVGGHVTKQKGSGFEFDQIRAYSYGDDIRFVDWNSSARSGKLLVRQYLDEKNRTIIVCLDVSISTLFASKHAIMSDVMRNIAAVLSFVADYEQDAVGLLLFSDTVELFIPPSRGHRHTLHIVETILSYKPKTKKTDFNCLVSYLLESYKHQGALIIISDFIADTIDRCLKQLVCKREIIAIRCLDEGLKTIPSVGYVFGQDPETQEQMLLYFSDKYAEQLEKTLQQRCVDQNQLFKSCRIDCLDILSDKDYVETLLLFFKRRMAIP